MRLPIVSQRQTLLSVLLCLSVLAPNVQAQSGNNGLQQTQSVVAGGGGESTAVSHSLVGTVGQPILGVSSGGGFTVSSGFFSESIVGTPTASDSTVTGTITTADGTAVEGVVIMLSGSQTRKTITDSNGRYQFNNVETNGFYTVTPARANYTFNPFNRSFSLVGNQTEALFTGTRTGDNANPLDTAEYFVRQQYVDVLGREPDQGGFNFWSARILVCGNDADCIRSRRIAVAAEFFIHQEFQQSGAFIYNLYEAALSRRPAYTEFAADRRQVLGGPGLEAEKQAFAENFVKRADFITRYQSNSTAESFVDALLASAPVDGSGLSGQRSDLISIYNFGASMELSRALVLRAIADDAAFKQAQYNGAFVLTEYFSYLRRDPDRDGYDFWVNMLNNGGNGDRDYHGMVCSFITSTEYQRRFSAVVSHSNIECRQ